MQINILNAIRLYLSHNIINHGIISSVHILQSSRNYLFCGEIVGIVLLRSQLIASNAKTEIFISFYSNNINFYNTFIFYRQLRMQIM